RARREWVLRLSAPQRLLDFQNGGLSTLVVNEVLFIDVYDATESRHPCEQDGVGSLLAVISKQVVAAGLHADQDFAIDHVAGQDTEVSDSTTTSRPSTHHRVLVLPDPRVPHERGLPGVLRVLQYLGDSPIDQPFGRGRGGRHE